MSQNSRTPHILIGLFLFLLSYLCPFLGFADDLRLHFIDIGQGDSALIQSPTNKVILIDSGPSKSRQALFDYLKKVGVKEVDLMINLSDRDWSHLSIVA